MELAIQLDHRFGSKWLLNKFHWFGCTGSYACRDTKVQILLPRISDDSSILGTTSDEQINDEAEVDIELEGLLSIAATAGDDQVVSMHGGRMYKLSHSVCWRQYRFEHNGNAPFHSMGLIKVTSQSPAPASYDSDDQYSQQGEVEGTRQGQDPESS